MSLFIARPCAGWSREEVLLQNDNTMLKSHAVCKDLNVDPRTLWGIYLFWCWWEFILHTLQNRQIFCRSTKAANPFMFGYLQFVTCCSASYCKSRVCLSIWRRWRLFALKMYLLQARFTVKTKLTCLWGDHADGKKLELFMLRNITKDVVLSKAGWVMRIHRKQKFLLGGQYISILNKFHMIRANIHISSII